MERFAYASPVLPGKESAIREYNKGKKTSFYEKGKMYWKEIGVNGWACYLQELEGRYYFIHVVEADSIDEVFDKFRKELRAKVPRAVELHAYYLNVLGKDYSSPEMAPKIDKVFDLALDHPSAPLKEHIGYMYPLLPGKVGAHKAYCQKAMSEKKEGILEMYRATGILRMTKWIQTKPTGDYVVYFQERSIPYVRKNLSEDPVMLKRLEPLMEHTGLSSEALLPKVEHLLIEQNS